MVFWPNIADSLKYVSLSHSEKKIFFFAFLVIATVQLLAPKTYWSKIYNHFFFYEEAYSHHSKISSKMKPIS